MFQHPSNRSENAIAAAEPAADLLELRMLAALSARTATQRPRRAHA